NYININSQTGITVPPESSAELRAAMDFLTDNPTAAQTMGERARARYESLFSADQLGCAYAELYKRLAITPVEHLLNAAINEQRV
ncbi:MAG TPA: hypothetical protein VLC91_09960, partial [Spongiibacteraceae bacterium]|nr:hypothetical protein [Spongiibacteraceae bacterium]